MENSEHKRMEGGPVAEPVPQYGKYILNLWKIHRPRSYVQIYTKENGRFE